MSTDFITRSLSVALASGVLLAVMPYPSHADKRSGLDDLSKEMSTCSAYFSLLAEIVGNAEGPAAKAEIAGRIKTTGQAMLVEAINVANYIGVADDVVMQRAHAAMDEMVATINADPPNSLAIMHTRYGVPCDQLLENAPRRFAELMARGREDF
jgi:hypothetical protein